jgi:hypothetical protein
MGNALNRTPSPALDGAGTRNTSGSLATIYPADTTHDYFPAAFLNSPATFDQHLTAEK